VGEGPEPVPLLGSRGRAFRIAAGICGSDCTPLADFRHFTVSWAPSACPRWTLRPTCVFGHEFWPEIVEHGPDTAATLPGRTRVWLRCPSWSAPYRRGADRRTRTRYPGASPQAHGPPGTAPLPRCPTRWPPPGAFTDRSPWASTAGGWRLSPGAPCLVGRLRGPPAAIHRRAQGARHGTGPGADFSTHPTPAGRGVRGRRGHRPRPGLAARPLVRLRNRPHGHGTHRVRHAGGTP